MTYWDRTVTSIVPIVALQVTRQVCHFKNRPSLGFGNAWRLYLHPLLRHSQKLGRSYFLCPFRVSGQLEGRTYSQYAEMGKQAGQRVLGVQPPKVVSPSYGKQLDGWFGEVYPGKVRKETVGARCTQRRQLQWLLVLRWREACEEYSQNADTPSEHKSPVNPTYSYRTEQSLEEEQTTSKSYGRTIHELNSQVSIYTSGRIEESQWWSEYPSSHGLHFVLVPSEESKDHFPIGG